MKHDVTLNQKLYFEMNLINQQNQSKYITGLLSACSDERAIDLAKRIAEKRKAGVPCIDLKREFEQEMHRMIINTDTFIEKTRINKYK